MPIKPENRSRYPADWPQVRERILKRAANCCEHPDCGARNYDVGFWRKQMGRFVWHEQVRGLRTWREASQWAAEWYSGASEEGPKPTVIVLTIAHMGLPAHLPMEFHVTRSTEANQVVDMVGFLMPISAELPEWAHMMHGRALSEFNRGSAAVSTSFFVASPGSHPGARPTLSVPHQATTVAPQWIRLTDWRLIGEPLEAARIAAEATAGGKVEAADLERLTAAFADTLAEPAFRPAQCFRATGVRAGSLPIGGLLRRQVEGYPANHAVPLCRTLADLAANAGALDAAPPGGGILQAAAIRAGLPWLSRDMRESNTAVDTGHGCGAESWSRHAGILFHADEYPENCADDNLRAMCQRHHLAHDHEHHRANAQATRRAKAGTLELFP